MSRIRGQDTSIELSLRHALWRQGLRYRKNFRKVIGRPDVAFVGRKIAVFCDSSFWHGRTAEKTLRKITSNTQYWRSKILGNVARDRRINRQLRKDGWKVLRFWDEEIEKNLVRCVARVSAAVLRADELTGRALKRRRARR
jgi:DNA mismatch endonuclease (patch repair protein)